MDPMGYNKTPSVFIEDDFLHTVDSAVVTSFWSNYGDRQHDQIFLPQMGGDCKGNGTPYFRET